MSRLPLNPEKSAKVAGLVYLRDDTAGFTRVRHGKGVSYFDTLGRPIRNARELARIRALVIPPAWKRVWICPRANGHLQAVGYDARGRKQYREPELATKDPPPTTRPSV
jgi:DNA topoisomerase-1